MAVRPASEQRLLVMPKLGLTMTDGVVARWNAVEGQRFAAGDVLVVIESEKTAFDIEAPAAGTLGKILVQELETVPVGTLLAQWQLDGKTAPPPVACDRDAGAPRPQKDGRRLATPLARRLAREGGLDLSEITGSGPRGRIQAADVTLALTTTAHAPPAAPAAESPVR